MEQQNREPIERILPLTAPIERRLGYEPLVKLRRQRSVLVGRGPRSLGPAPATQSLQSAPAPQPLAGAEVEREGRRPVGCQRLALAPITDVISTMRFGTSGVQTSYPQTSGRVSDAVSECAAEGLRDRPVVGTPRGSTSTAEGGRGALAPLVVPIAEAEGFPVHGESATRPPGAGPADRSS